MKQDQNWLAEMESRRRDDEPSPEQEMADLMRRTDEVLKWLSPENGAKLRELSAGWRELVLAGYALSCGYTTHAADGVGELLTAAPEGAARRAENLRLTRAAEALADTVPEALPLSDRWDDLCTLALVLGQRQ